MNDLNDLIKNDGGNSSNPQTQQQTHLMLAKLNMKKFNKIQALILQKHIESHRNQEIDQRQKK